MRAMKERAIRTTAWLIILPILPFWFVMILCEGMTWIASWATVERPWTIWLINRAEAFARRFGVKL